MDTGRRPYAPDTHEAAARLVELLRGLVEETHPDRVGAIAATLDGDGERASAGVREAARLTSTAAEIAA